jgi:hypothetical protein
LILLILDKIEKILWQNYITSKDVTITSVKVGSIFFPLLSLCGFVGIFLGMENKELEKVFTSMYVFYELKTIFLLYYLSWWYLIRFLS